METTDVFCIICIVWPLSQPPPSIPVISLAPPTCLWRSSVQAHVLVHLLQMISVSVAQRYKICLPMQETRVPSLGREDPLEEETANPLQCSCWDNPMDRDQQATVHNVTKSQTWLSTHTWLSGNKANHPGYPTIPAVHFLDLSCNGLKSQVSHFSYPCWTKKEKEYSGRWVPSLWGALHLDISCSPSGSQSLCPIFRQAFLTKSLLRFSFPIVLCLFST